MPQIQNIDRGVDIPKCVENGDSHYHERPVCTPEACDELSWFYGLISIRDSEGDVDIEVNECGG